MMNVVGWLFILLLAVGNLAPFQVPWFMILKCQMVQNHQSERY